MKNKLTIMSIIWIFFLSCSNSNTTYSDKDQNSYSDENSNTPSDDSNILSPEEWLQKYNEAWLFAINKSLKLLPVQIIF